MSFVFRPLMTAALIALAAPVFAQTPTTSAPVTTPAATMTPSMPAKTDAKSPVSTVRSSSTDAKGKAAGAKTAMIRHHHKMNKNEIAKADTKTDAKSGATDKAESTTAK